MNKIIFIFSVFLAFETIQVFSAKCRVKDDMGIQYDLSKIPASSYEASNITMDEFYKFNLCNDVEELHCKTLNGILCSYEPNGKFKKRLALHDKSYLALHQENGLHLVYQNIIDEPMDEEQQKQITVNFNIICSREDSDSSVSHAFWDNEYFVVLHSPAGCPVASKGISGGWIFVITLFSFLFLWLVIGTSINIFIFKARKDKSAIIGIEFIMWIYTNMVNALNFFGSMVCGRKSKTQVIVPSSDDGGYSTF